MDYRKKLKNPKAYEKSQGPMYRMFNMAMGFGISLAVSLFIMIKLGNWIDGQFSIAPYGTFGCVLVAIAASFRTLYREVLRLETEEAQERKNDESDNN